MSPATDLPTASTVIWIADSDIAATMRATAAGAPMALRSAATMVSECGSPSRSIAVIARAREIHFSHSINNYANRSYSMPGRTLH